MRIPYKRTVTLFWSALFSLAAIAPVSAGRPLTKTIAMDVTEGTWLSLDVSPNGKQIVFDLLGDLYLLPIEGGNARALTSGVDWDMQPRFSPDGTHIAFTSDRGGGDNVWTVKTDGTSATAVTKESFRLLNSPQWSPDGRYLVARKHFTSRRSLGAGELWMVHRDGGKGLQLTERSNDQKDLGEPAFSPDGKWVYFSRDATPGSVFEYNKDPHAGIYVIDRLELASGRTERVVGGAGGAIRPTPSPDGKTLAFVRRVGAKTVLHVLDLASGATRPLYDGLDRDLQETWAIHGVYPAMAFTPDSSEIVLWAGGGLHRVAVANGQATPIPFRVKTRRQVLPALRFPVEVAPKKQRARNLRGVVVAPDGKSVVYQALGVLYRRTLPSGKPTRLTSATSEFEAMPAFSRDGTQIVYVSWDDQALGAIRVIPASGGVATALTTQPGHYVEPAFAPDGQTVVYRKTGGGWLTSPLWSAKPGLYRVPAAGGTAVRIHKDGRSPHFAADSDRLFYVDSGAKGLRTLSSIGMDGKESRVHLRSKQARTFRVSPDGAHAAFSEHSKIYVLPFRPTGRAVDVGAKFDGVPLASASVDAAFSMGWSDAKTLHWVRGPELLSWSVGSDKPTMRGRDISFEYPSDIPSGTVAIVGARVVTLKGDTVHEDGSVVIRGDRITAVGARTGVTIPKGATILDGAGLTVVPGFIDVHAHGAQAANGMTPEANWGNYANLAFGVTTIHDPSNDTESVFAAAELQRAGKVVAPRIYSTGTILYGATGQIQAPIETLEDARGHLRRMKAMGATSVKSYNQPRRDQRRHVLGAAKELQMMVVPEGGSLFQHNMTQVVDGHTGIEHAIPLARLYDDVLTLWAGTDVRYTPTLNVAYGGLFGENYWYAQSKVYEHARLKRFVPRKAFIGKARRRLKVDADDYNHVSAAREVHRLAQRGVRMQVGGHGQREGLGVHWEIWSLAQGGLTPLECLRAASLNGAAYLGMDKDLGSIEVGKLADLAVIDGNPLTDLRTTEKVKWVIQGGKVFEAATMRQTQPVVRNAPRFFFHPR
ncbi:MAG: imidazolonepropionase-like amidohydrolase/Tol biopolymer transport system component [Myxococcota bacterium]|jgi:imidazolonepropionase-like amidohydrolase/Tol biopolymer transport system component